jgi:C4-dicarboxylate transporter DctM subunit
MKEEGSMDEVTVKVSKFVGFPEQTSFRRMFVALGRTIDYASTIGGGLSAALILATSFIVFYEIVMRAFFNSPTTWVLEYSIYMLIATGFLGAGYLTKLGGHVCVDVITSRLSDKTKAVLDFVTHLWSIGFTLILVGSSIFVVRQSIVQHRLSSSILETPMFITEIPVAVGAVLLLFQLIRMAIGKWILITQIKGGTRQKATFVSPVDNPTILIPIVIILLGIGIILFNLGSGYQVTGLILVMLTLFAAGTPIFLVLAILGSFGLFCLLGGTLSSQIQVALQAYRALDSFTLEAIPLFIMGASLFATTRLTDGLFDIAKSWLSFLPANLLMATITCCAIFAAITGSSVANAATIGLVAIPPMLAANYEKEMALGSVAAGGTLGILIPPSLSFILIGEITQTSVGQLFIAGIIPGIFISLVFMSYIYIKTHKNPRYKPTIIYTWKDRFHLLKKGGPVLLAPVIILGGIYSGLTTPTEAAAVTVIYAIFLGLVTGKLNRQNLLVTLRDSTKSAIMILMIIAGAMILGSVVTILRIPHNFSVLIVESGIPAWAVIVLMNLLLLILGMFLECASITLITVPIFYPTIQALGFDPLWFGVIFTINMELALVTPPVGLNLYIIQGITGEKMETVVRGVFQFIILLALGLLIVALIEPMSTWLPSKMIGK